MELPKLGVSELIKLINTQFEITMPEVMVEGEVGEYRGANRNGHHYFSLKDSDADVRCVVFAGRAFQMVIEDGMKVIVRAKPNLHNKYGFSLIVSSVRPSGEGELKKAFELTKKKLAAEGLFEDVKKRNLPEFPNKIGLVTSSGAAAYTDVLDILRDRWPIADVIHAQTGVQGEAAIDQIVTAIDSINEQPDIDVLLLVRGGGSAEDLSVFSSEEVVRAVARSRAPIVVGVGHERDVSLADLAADLRANTPTDAAQRATPDMAQLRQQVVVTHKLIIGSLDNNLERLQVGLQTLVDGIAAKVSDMETWLDSMNKRLIAYSPQLALEKGYSVLRKNGEVVSSVDGIISGDIINVKLTDGELEAEVKNVKE